MDPFQVRMDFLFMLKRLNASQQSIHKNLAFAAKHSLTCSDDLWECIVSECEKGSLNTRINIIFLLDALFTDEYFASSGLSPLYRPLLARDLDHLIDLAVPPQSWDAVLNLGTVKQIVSSWKKKQILDREFLSAIEMKLEAREAQLQDLSLSERDSFTSASRPEVLQRIEEDRERHKRLRERVWILPPNDFSGLFSERRHTVEFDQSWDDTSDFNEDDADAIKEEKVKWWGWS
ncbi:hypothetical protein IE53DRAFT_317475 [Violaceomyces palustris]|uniref:Uncharacterized protein n=1 Tax=Violaceomyces palustris TaxID=1673888 RepID=A0ACD0NUP1_9BASI|nr:hypothetical protein IE53DRAFT_317475 [Violaceomyces palustris]